MKDYHGTYVHRVDSTSLNLLQMKPPYIIKCAADIKKSHKDSVQKAEKQPTIKAREEADGTHGEHLRNHNLAQTLIALFGLVLGAVLICAEGSKSQEERMRLP